MTNHGENALLCLESISILLAELRILYICYVVLYIHTYIHIVQSEWKIELAQQQVHIFPLYSLLCNYLLSIVADVIVILSTATAVISYIYI